MCNSAHTPACSLHHVPQRLVRWPVSPNLLTCNPLPSLFLLSSQSPPSFLTSPHFPLVLLCSTATRLAVRLAVRFVTRFVARSSTRTLPLTCQLVHLGVDDAPTASHQAPSEEAAEESYQGDCENYCVGVVHCWRGAVGAEGEDSSIGLLESRIGV